MLELFGTRLNFLLISAHKVKKATGCAPYVKVYASELDGRKKDAQDILWEVVAQRINNEENQDSWDVVNICGLVVSTINDNICCKSAILKIRRV